MACGCKGSNAEPAVVDGVVQLASYPECTELYSGANERTPIYIAGRGDAALERLFTQAQVQEAGIYARSIGRALVAYPAGLICSEAVLPLLEG